MVLEAVVLALLEQMQICKTLAVLDLAVLVCLVL
jgi:hypothetical protein